MKFTIGADPEIFAMDKQGNHVSLCGLIGGTKEKPKALAALGMGFAIQEDNVALEFNIPPCQDRVSFLISIRDTRNFIEQQLNSMLGLSLSKKCSVSFDKKELTHPNALIFGCEPDFDAWSLTENKKPTCEDKSLRTAGGHIHVGANKDMIAGVRHMDLFLGVPSVILDDTKESVIRRQLYGKAGAMRPTHYGWEYRALSNYWIFSDELINWVYRATYMSLDYKHKLTKKEEGRIISCINTGDKKVAEQLVKEYSLIMP